MTGPFSELVAPPQWRCIDFISDLHLAEESPRNFEAWSAFLCMTPADAVFILGDLFEAWVGDDSRHAGFEARCAAALTEAARRIQIAFLVGNRDFLLGRDMTEACGLIPLKDPTVLVAFGERVMLSHGDELCTADLAYQRVRATVRQPEWQRHALSLPLDERRVMARAMRTESERHQRGQYDGAWFDIDHPLALARMREADAPLLIHGHTHRPSTDVLAPGFTRHVLSDWDLDDEKFPRAEVLRWEGETLRRVAPEGNSLRPS